MPALASLSPEDHLDRALHLLMSLEVEDLPVVEHSRSARVIGILSRRDITAAYAHRRFGASLNARAL
jgi:CBS domain-containing protein